MSAVGSDDIIGGPWPDFWVKAERTRFGWRWSFGEYQVWDEGWRPTKGMALSAARHHAVEAYYRMSTFYPDGELWPKPQPYERRDRKNDGF